MGRSSAVGATVLALLMGSSATAQTRFALDNLTYQVGANTVGPITFSESQFPVNTVINGYSITTIGSTPLPGTLSFTFTVYNGASNDATIKDFSGFPFANLSGRVLEGAAPGILTIDFGADASNVSFDVAFDAPAGEAIPNAVTLKAFTLFSNPLATGSANAGPLPPFEYFPEAHVSLTTQPLMRRVVIDFETELPEEVPLFSGWGLGALIVVVAAAGAAFLRRTY